MASQDEAPFQFVEWSDVAGPTKNAATRVLIRRQAMSKAAAARKERGDWGKKTNFRKRLVCSNPSEAIPDHSPTSIEKSSQKSRLRSPSSVQSHSDSDVDESETSDDLVATDDQRGLDQDQPSASTTVPPKMACTGYELLRLESDFDILDLSALTTFHVGRITTAALHTSPVLLNNVLQCRQWSYFSYVPGRFGHFACLDDAARCVSSRVRLWIQGVVTVDVVTLALYSKAIDSLQAAINDPHLRVMSETLCATELLSLYELLDNTKSRGWAQHAAGAKSLLRLRGPQRFTTSFDRALFMSQIGPIYTESILEGLECFLGEPEWQSVLKSVVDEQPITTSPLSDCGTVVISLWYKMLLLPSLWKAVQSAILCADFTTASEIPMLQNRVFDLITQVSLWRSKYEPILKSVPDPSIKEAREEKRFETLGMCLVCLLILKRLKIALDPFNPEALGTEVEVEGIAKNLLQLEKTAIANNARAGLFMKFKFAAAQATLATTADWRITSVVDSRVGANGLIAREHHALTDLDASSTFLSLEDYLALLESLSASLTWSAPDDICI